VLSVVIPVFNEEKGLAATLDAVAALLARIAPEGHEIVVSDDGSRDRSAAIAETAARRFPISVLRSPANRGKGAAVRAGMLAARGDERFFFDADLSTPLEEIPRFREALRAGAAVAIGTRKHKDARIVQSQPWHRVALGKSYTHLANAVLGLHASDFTCGFKAFSGAAATEIFRRQRLERWSFDAEILFLAHRLGLRVAELPVRWSDRPDSRVRVGSAVVKSFAELLEIRRHARAGSYE
jgi:dolichyl-phosphate beta-glucosyltransferase